MEKLHPLPEILEGPYLQADEEYPNKDRFLLGFPVMATSRTQQLQDDLLKAAISFLEYEGTHGHSLLIQLPGGTKLGIEVEFLVGSGPQPRDADSRPRAAA